MLAQNLAKPIMQDFGGHIEIWHIDVFVEQDCTSDCWVRTCEAAIQIHGASGYMVEYEIERELRDAVASRLYSGTDEIQRSIIASMLGM